VGQAKAGFAIRLISYIPKVNQIGCGNVGLKIQVAHRYFPVVDSFVEIMIPLL